MVLLSKLIS